MAIPTDLSSIVVAIGGLGTAAFGLVDATKIGSNGGVSNAGFGFIQDAIRKLIPRADRSPSSSVGGGSLDVLDALHGNWINGKPLADQKTIAKSLLKLQLSPATAADFAKATGVDAATLSAVAASMTSGTALTSAQSDVLGRFDLALTVILDRGYQRADQKYRNASKVLAMVFAIVLAVLGGWSTAPSAGYFGSADMWTMILFGVLATPFAPISKDLASALSAAVKAAQIVRR